ncbi:MAG: transcriptional regulator [Candidatus Hydrogenedentota bacterium]|nr:MAG: transcriptional regulator [Candidatus Hydrogenedentota bacterium]
MKEIKAYIKPHKLSEVTLALHQVEGLNGMSVSDGRGFGRGKAKNSSHSSKEDLVDYLPHVRIEIVCPDELAETVVSAIQKNAHTGLRGDGKIYISSLEAAVRISTGEHGHDVY